MRARSIKNAGMMLMLGLAALLVVTPLILIFIHIVRMGAGSINLDFFTQIPNSPGESGGGMANGIAGSALLILLASSFGIPTGIFGALYLSEYEGNRLTSIIRFSADVLAGVPSIITGLVAYTLIVVPMHGFSALAGAFALGLIMIPIVLRTTEEQLKMVPGTLREASLALGVPFWRTTLQVTLRSSLKGIVTGILLSVARVSGETAPLLFTALGNQFWNKKLTDPIAALPLQIFNFAISPYDDWHRLAWGGALVLVVIMFGVSLTARWFSRDKSMG